MGKLRLSLGYFVGYLGSDRMSSLDHPPGTDARLLAALNLRLALPEVEGHEACDVVHLS